MYAFGRHASRERRRHIFAAPINEGNSGGPLLTDGKVVGLITLANATAAYAAAAASVALYFRGSGLADNLALGLSAAQARQLIGENEPEAMRAAALRSLARAGRLKMPLADADKDLLLQDMSEATRRSLARELR